MEWQLILAVIGAFGTLVTGAITIYLRKQTKRLKTAEAFQGEVEALKSTIKELRDQVIFYKSEVEGLQRMFTEKEAFYLSIIKEKVMLEKKHYRNKAAMACAYDCRYNPDAASCPVIMKKIQNDTEYLNELENENKQMV